MVSLAVLGEPYPAEYGEFGYERWGCRMGLRFPVVSLAAYRGRWAELEASANPFAVVTQAHLQAQETAGAVSARYAAKLTLVRSLYRRGYSRQDILEIFRFVDWVLALPEVLEQQLWTEMQQFEEEKRMRYVSSFERIAQKRGLEKGIGQGQTKLLNMLLRQRFGALPDWAQARCGRPSGRNWKSGRCGCWRRKVWRRCLR